MTTTAKDTARRRPELAPPVGEDYSILDQLANEPAPRGHAESTLIRLAVIAAACDNGGIVTAATLRPLLPETVNPHRIGAVVSALVKQGILVRTGRYAESSNRKWRNMHRPMPVYEVNTQAVAA